MLIQGLPSYGASPLPRGVPVSSPSPVSPTSGAINTAGSNPFNLVQSAQPNSPTGSYTSAPGTPPFLQNTQVPPPPGIVQLVVQFTKTLRLGGSNKSGSSESLLQSFTKTLSKTLNEPLQPYGSAFDALASLMADAEREASDMDTLEIEGPLPSLGVALASDRPSSPFSTNGATSPSLFLQA